MAIRCVLQVCFCCFVGLLALRGDSSSTHWHCLLMVTKVPFADGGEGTLDAVLSAWGTHKRTCETTDALGRPIKAGYGISPDGKTGLVEAAQANGLAAVQDEPLQPCHATTRGVGTMIKAVLDDGVQEVLLTIGGSATTDGGLGLMRELGARFLDAQGNEIGQDSTALPDLASIDMSDVDPRASGVRWKIANDVTNPLTGPLGAAQIFGPQKGCTPRDVAALDAGLERLGQVVQAASGAEVQGVAGLGAAGGMSLMPYAFFGAQPVPGWQLVAETLGAREILKQADLVLTGEGSFDSQSLGGKVVDGVRQMIRPGTPLVVLAGRVSLDAQALHDSGVTAAFAIAREPRPLHESVLETAENIAWTADQAVRMWLAGITSAARLD